MFAQVTFPISSFQTFSYEIPKELINNVIPGTCITAPLNKRKQIGFVVSISEAVDFKGKILPLSSIHEDNYHFQPELWNTLKWISKYYITPFGQVLKTALPLSFTEPYSPKRIQFVSINANGYEALKKWGKSAPAQKNVLEALALLNEPIKVAGLMDIVSSPQAICNALSKKGFVDIVMLPKIYDPFDLMAPGLPGVITLTKDQNKVYSTISKSMNKDKFAPFLLRGVTGSGKTEVYLKLAQDAVKHDKTVLVLVPEIALTPQVAKRFRNAFGEKVALWHSKMTKAEKGWTWQQLKKGKYKVVVGARSAVFAPLNNLGLIIVDEEQETTYKQEAPAPRYHARNVALIRGKHANASVLLTSATPSLESYYNAIQGKLTRLDLTKRFGDAQYPTVDLVDMMREGKETGNIGHLFSTKLTEAIQSCLSKKEQIILLQNRRGFSVIHQCKECGFVAQCHQCSVSLTYHKYTNLLVCHYCKHEEMPSPICPECKHDEMELLGTGTQKVEDEVQREFPNARILRMDMDTVSKRGAHQRILEAFENHEADILLGTQMIAKGLDFENVTLVGIINADIGLFLPDFRAGERIFQLIYQVAGRAGRHKKPGSAIIQSYNPDDAFIHVASRLDNAKFYNIALAQRQELHYPPFSRLTRILCTGKDKSTVNSIASHIANRMKKSKHHTVLGPSPAPIERIQEQWRSHIIIKSHETHVHKTIEKELGYQLFERPYKGVRITIDVDPISML